MSDCDYPDERIQWLTSRLVEGDASEEEIAEWNRLLQSDPKGPALVADYLLLDSMLSEELGTESLTALVDLVANPESTETDVAAATTANCSQPGGSHPRSGWSRRYAGWLVAAAAAVVVGVFLAGRLEQRAYAKATMVVQAALRTHSQPIERVYVVDVRRDEAANARAAVSRDVRVITQGDRFWVEMNRGDRRWAWGRDTDGAIWLTLGPRRAMRIEPDEIGAPLQHIADLYSLELESLLGNVLRGYRVEYVSDSGTTHVVSARPRRDGKGWMKEVTIEVDKETKAIQRLVVERDMPQRGASTLTCTLVDARAPDDSLYRAEGHMSEPFRLLTRHAQPDKRRDLLVKRFGPGAQRWIK